MITVKFFAWRSFIFETWHLEQRDTRLAMKVVPFVRGLGLTFGTWGSPGTVYCVTGEIIVRDVLRDDSTRCDKIFADSVGRLPQRHRTLRKVQ